jgi:hypothetical protein
LRHSSLALEYFRRYPTFAVDISTIIKSINCTGSTRIEMGTHMYRAPLSFAAACIAIVALTGCSPTVPSLNNGDTDDAAGSDTTSISYVGACPVPTIDEWSLVDSLPAGFDPFTTPDCIYDIGGTPSAYSVFYLDGGETAIAANDASFAGAGWEEVDDHAWDNPDVGTINMFVVDADTNTSQPGLPEGFSGVVTMAILSSY